MISSSYTYALRHAAQMAEAVSRHPKLAAPPSPESEVSELDQMPAIDPADRGEVALVIE